MSSPPRERGRQPERARCAILAVALLKVVRCLTVPSAIELLTLCLCTSRCDHSLTVDVVSLCCLVVPCLLLAVDIPAC